LIAALESETSARALVTGSPFLVLVTSRLAALAKVFFFCLLSLIIIQKRGFGFLFIYFA